MLKITEVTAFVFMLHQHVLSWQNKTKSELGHNELQAERSQRFTVTCSIYDGTGSLQGTETFSSKGDILLAER